MKIIIAFFCFFSFLQLNLKSQIIIGETELDTTTIITGLDIPWEIQWGPDNYIWITERFGRISRIHPETGDQDIILDLSDQVYQSGESGLLGMVLHPEFEAEPYVYLAYTYRPEGQILEKIVRYEYTDGTLINEYVLLDDIIGNTTHNGCRIILLADNTLLLTTGDAQNQPAAQDIEHLSGKTLRINLDGSVPDDNPFPGNPVYSFGHRNAQGLFLAPNGIIYSSEHGPNTDDELNMIEPGRNYGWPNVHGFCNLPDEITFCDANDVFEPLVAWTPTIATSDIVYFNHPSIPEWQEKILLTSLKNKRLYVLELNEDGTQIIGESQYLNNWWGRLRDICIAPDGSIYLATNGPDWGNSEPFTHSIVKLWNPNPVSISTLNKNNSNLLTIFPNPASSFVGISVVENLIGHQINILSTEGLLLFSQEINSTDFFVPVQSFKAGIYVVSISSDQETVCTKKLIIW